MKHQRFQGHGLSLMADVAGPADGPLVLFMHGGGQTRHSWGGTAAALAAEGWYAIAYDQRGHGTSDRAPDRDYSNQSFAEDCVDVCLAIKEYTGIAPVVVGASLGGLSALLAEGAHHPGCTSAVVLVDITPRMEPEGVDRIVGFMLDRAETGFESLDEAADAIDRDAPRRVELTFAVAARPELHEIAAELAVELLDAMVVRIDDPHIALAVACDAGGIVEVRVGRPEIAPEDDEVAGIVELLNAVVAVIDDEQRPLLVHAESVHRRHEFAAVQQRRAAARRVP